MTRDFEDVGQFWCPEDPEFKVGGTLHYTAEEGAKLRLLGSFAPLGEEIDRMAKPREAHVQPVVLGQTAGSRRVTLLGCRDGRGKTIDLEYGGTTEKWMDVSVLIKGAHLDRDDQVLFDSFSARLSHLDEWAWLFRFDPADCPLDAVKRVRTLKYTHPEPVSMQMGGGWRARVSLEVAGPQWERPQRGISIQTKTWLELIPESPCTLDQAARRLRVWSTFLELAAQDPVATIQSRGTLATQSGESAPASSRTSVEIFCRERRAGMPIRQLVPPHDLLFTLRDMGLDPGRHIRAWEGAVDRFGSVLDLYFQEVEREVFHLRPRFLNLVHAAEGYHRRAIGGTERSEEKHEEMRREILESVPSDLRGWLEGRLKHSNDLNLATRLSALCKKHSTQLKKVAPKRSWIGDAVDIRNDYSHETGRTADRHPSEVLTVTERLKLLLDLALLSECGFEEARVEELMNRYWERHPPLLARDAGKCLLR